MTEKLEKGIFSLAETNIVYCLTNPSMPNVVKIGSTSNIERRLKDLDTTSVPVPFECELALLVEDGLATERLLHDAFGDHRIRKSREFFEISPQRVIAAMQLTGGTDVTPEADYQDDPDSENALKRRRGAFNFRMVDVDVGTELYFRANAGDDGSITATVCSHNRVTFQDEEQSLSAAATKIMNSRGYQNKAGYGGPYYWYLDGESMWERRLRMEREGAD